MAAATGILLHHPMTAGQALSGPTVSPQAAGVLDSSGTGTSAANGSDSSSATISANDFLTLLVTEMQNQDPTADTDPNEYVNQLVQVNSLEQLIDINQTLTTGLTPASTAGAAQTTSTQSAHAQLGLSPAAAESHLLTGAPIHAPATSVFAAAQSPAPTISGNLSVPAASPASRRVAHALDGRSHAQPGETRNPPTQ